MRYSIMAYDTYITDSGIHISESNQSGITIEDSDGSDNLGYLLEFLMEEQGEHDRTCNPYTYLKVCWDLAEFTAPLFRMLGESSCKELASTNRTVYQSAGNQFFKLFYIPHKVFGIDLGKYTANIYEISQYFRGKPKPETVDYLAWCGEQVMEAFRKMGLYPKKLTSAIAIYQAEAMKGMTLPTVADIPNGCMEAAEYATACMDRELRAVYKIGHWEG